MCVPWLCHPLPCFAVHLLRSNLQDDSNFDINIKDHLTGCTALHSACVGGNPAVIQHLLDCKADPSICADSLQTPLHHAATHGRDKAAAFLINVCSKEMGNDWDVDVKDINGCTPLHAAAARGHIKVVDILVGAGARLELGNFCGATALHYAASNGQKRVVQRLLRRKADAGIADQHGCTALHVAAFYGQDSVARLLLAAGAQADAIDVFGMSPLDTALACGNVAVCSVLQQDGGAAMHDYQEQRNEAPDLFEFSCVSSESEAKDLATALRWNKTLKELDLGGGQFGCVQYTSRGVLCKPICPRCLLLTCTTEVWYASGRPCSCV